jgi:hypothetical protein
MWLPLSPAHVKWGGSVTRFQWDDLSCACRNRVRRPTWKPWSMPQCSMPVYPFALGNLRAFLQYSLCPFVLSKTERNIDMKAQSNSWSINVWSSILAALCCAYHQCEYLHHQLCQTDRLQNLFDETQYTMWTNKVIGIRHGCLWAHYLAFNNCIYLTYGGIHWHLSKSCTRSEVLRGPNFPIHRKQSTKIINHLDQQLFVATTLRWTITESWQNL